MSEFHRGTLLGPADAPARGERSQPVARLGGVVVEHVVSGALAAPADYDQPFDEWAVVLEGGAVLEVDGSRLDLGPGSWVLLPAHLPHRLVETQPGTTSLTVSATP
ncbi:MAG TPA: cupin domain-containing protein [Acidimicrobiales bacterium]|nr:cupin domain-containing protein [Acidimicrobiales bacterium]